MWPVQCRGRVRKYPWKEGCRWMRWVAVMHQTMMMDRVLRRGYKGSVSRMTGNDD